MKVVCIIPARLHSTRFPRKVLSQLGPKPLLQWIWEAACSCLQFNQVAFAVDDCETAALIKTFQGNYFMTDKNCLSGTDRLIELMDSRQLEGDIWVNWQGDEPFINVKMIDNLLQSISTLDSDIWTLKKKITNKEEINSPHIVKVVTDLNGQALYFSRTSIPYKAPIYYKHIGLYAYQAKALKSIQKMSRSSLEKAESLEQLRFMEGGLKIKVHETNDESQGIDLPEDLLKALKMVQSSLNEKQL